MSLTRDTLDVSLFLLLGRYFILRSVVSPIECAEDPTAEDCTDVEVVSPNLVATKLQIEVDTRYGHYGMCNICNAG